MAYRRIHNKGDWRHEELLAAGTITPGMLLEVTTSGTVRAHATEGGCAERLIAVEDALQGQTVDDDYSASDVVSMAVAAPGAVFNMLMKKGETGSPGQEVVSAGDGTLILVDNISTGTTMAQVIGRIDASEAAFGALAADTLKAIRIV